MPHKDRATNKAKHKEYSAKHYQNNKEEVQRRTRENNAADKAKWAEFKKSLSCTVCGASHPAIIDFHHPPGTKTYSVNKLVVDRKFAKVYEEIKKCVVLCANCHRIHHYNEKGAVAPHISAN
jgi:acetylornithine/succinyldiaminopimelate/putrescine aminotransferase